MLKIGVFGVGLYGQSLLQQLKQIDGVDIVGIYDIDANLLEQLSKENNTATFKNIDELIAQSTAICIATPTYTHFEIAEKAIRKGKHVFVEIPLTTTIEEADKLVNLVAEANVKLQVSSSLSYYAAFMALETLEINPLWIEIKRQQKYTNQQSDLCIVMDFMIDDIDIILKLAKSDLKKISAFGESIMSENTDITNVRFEFANGCIATIAISNMAINQQHSLTIYQKNEQINVDLIENNVEVIQLNKNFANTKLAEDTNQLFTVNQVQFENSNRLKTQLEQFKNAIINDTNTITTCEHGYLCLDIATKILKKINKTIEE
jgi:predicted dehydrogenase